MGGVRPDAAADAYLALQNRLVPLDVDAGIWVDPVSACLESDAKRTAAVRADESALYKPAVGPSAARSTDALGGPR